MTKTESGGIPLRALIRATGGRPYFIRETRLTPEGAARYLQSKAPTAKVALLPS